jgi:hypothetical protein
MLVHERDGGCCIELNRRIFLFTCWFAAFILCVPRSWHLIFVQWVSCKLCSLVFLDPWFVSLGSKNVPHVIFWGGADGQHRCGTERK